MKKKKEEKKMYGLTKEKYDKMFDKVMLATAEITKEDRFHFMMSLVRSMVIVYSEKSPYFRKLRESMNEKTDPNLEEKLKYIG